MRSSELKEIRLDIDSLLLKQLRSLKDNYTIVHCHYQNIFWLEEKIRIWPTTYLVQENASRKKLLHAFNVPLYPDWEIIKSSTYHFTLLFEGLDKDCLLFDLLEDIPEGGEFFVPGIRRNKTDVYNVQIQ